MRVFLATASFLLVASASVASADVLECKPQQITSADDGYASPDAHGHRLYHRDLDTGNPLFQIKPSVYNRPIPGGQNGFISVVVTTDGKVECLDPLHGWSLQRMGLTRQRRALLQEMDTWRFDPVSVNGVPVRARVAVWIPEEVHFNFHEDMPKAPLSEMSVTLQRSDCGLGACPDYTVTVHGDGRVDYVGNVNVDVVGHHSWHIAPTAAEELFQHIRAADVWSAAGIWTALLTDSPQQTLTLNIGLKSREIVDYVGENVGMPKTVTEAETEIDAMALTADVVHFTARGLHVLNDEKFDFKSVEGANLLARVSADREASEDMVLALLDLGAPPEGGVAGWPERRDDTHIVFREVQKRNWLHAIAWLKGHGFQAQLEKNPPLR
ncbi:DUF6438 domain-containing protein [Asticcacaulis benevestitus]|uniref:DUF6438 domain-containing protein n=1 Tax=Asticcacaulis benevestitus DSM 16100 = ATCC BAA-896 TaxID=1121022 RepID=V4NU52_9CAUL|nr:DUF6438 domain-containing protein [Asticcacaulis benevestitus]ESQ85352.1 hypothetical protein ABENE_19060 [Asticcacaulis benevestitus DSM 16100 = ATCC BAA-896]